MAVEASSRIATVIKTAHARVSNSLQRQAEKFPPGFQKNVARVQEARDRIGGVVVKGAKEGFKFLKDPRAGIMRAFRHAGARSNGPDAKEMFAKGSGEGLMESVANGGENNSEVTASSTDGASLQADANTGRQTQVDASDSSQSASDATKAYTAEVDKTLGIWATKNADAQRIQVAKVMGDATAISNPKDSWEQVKASDEYTDYRDYAQKRHILTSRRQIKRELQQDQAYINETNPDKQRQIFQAKRGEKAREIQKITNEYVQKELTSPEGVARLTQLVANGDRDIKAALERIQNPSPQGENGSKPNTVKVQDGQGTNTSTQGEQATSDTTEASQQEATSEAELTDEIISTEEEQAVGEILKGLNTKNIELDVDPYTKQLIGSVRELSRSVAPKVLRQVIAQGIRLAKVEGSLAAMQAEYANWSLINENQKPGEIDAKLAEQQGLLRKGDLSKEKQEEVHARIAQLQKAKEKYSQENLGTLREEERKAKINGKVEQIGKDIDPLIQRRDMLRKRYQQSLSNESFSNHHENMFFKELAVLPQRMQENPQQAANLLKIFEEGKKKGLGKIALGILLIAAVAAFTQGMQVTPQIISQDAAA